MCSCAWGLCVLMQVNSTGQFSAFTQCFLQTESHISKWKIHMVLQLLPKMSIVLEQILKFKPRVTAALSGETSPVSSPRLLPYHQVPIPSNHCSHFYHLRLICFFWNFIYMKSLYSLCPGSNIFKFNHVTGFLEGSSLLWLSRYSIIYFSIFLVVIIMAITVPFFIIMYKATMNILYIFVCILIYVLISLRKILRSEIAGYGIHLILWEMVKQISKVVYHFTLPSVMLKVPGAPYSQQHLTLLVF